MNKITRTLITATLALATATIVALGVTGTANAQVP